MAVVRTTCNRILALSGRPLGEASDSRSVVDQVFFSLLFFYQTRGLLFCCFEQKKVSILTVRFWTKTPFLGDPKSVQNLTVLTVKNGLFSKFAVSNLSETTMKIVFLKNALKKG